jgi:hypothetical protein
LQDNDALEESLSIHGLHDSAPASIGEMSAQAGEFKAAYAGLSELSRVRASSRRFSKFCILPNRACPRAHNCTEAAEVSERPAVNKSQRQTSLRSVRRRRTPLQTGSAGS